MLCISEESTTSQKALSASTFQEKGSPYEGWKGIEPRDIATQDDNRSFGQQFSDFATVGSFAIGGAAVAAGKGVVVGGAALMAHVGKEALENTVIETIEEAAKEGIISDQTAADLLFSGEIIKFFISFKNALSPGSFIARLSTIIDGAFNMFKGIFEHDKRLNNESEEENKRRQHAKIDKRDENIEPENPDDNDDDEDQSYDNDGYERRSSDDDDHDYGEQGAHDD